MVEEGGVEMSDRRRRRSASVPESGRSSPGSVPHGIVAGDEGARIVAIIVPKRESPDDISIEQGS